MVKIYDSNKKKKIKFHIFRQERRFHDFYLKTDDSMIDNLELLMDWTIVGDHIRDSLINVDKLLIKDGKILGVR